jgi:zinc metalloprotease ZmpA
VAGNTRQATGTGSLAGIGRSAAERIWYRALTTYFVSSTNYAAARVGTLNAAADLFGQGSAQYNAVAAAWSAVNVK